MAPYSFANQSAHSMPTIAASATPGGKCLYSPRHVTVAIAAINTMAASANPQIRVCGNNDERGAKHFERGGDEVPPRGITPAHKLRLRGRAAQGVE